MTTLGIWAPQGVVIPSVSGDSPQQPNVSYEGNAKILSGNVFKCWFSNNTNALIYAESTNGTSWTRYASAVIASGVIYPKIFINSGTYYLYCNPDTSLGSISLYTSTDGITWGSPTTNILQTGSGTWDDGTIGQFGIVGIIGGTWYGYYFGTTSGSPTVYYEGLATSTNGTSWTKSPSNPVISDGGPSNFHFLVQGALIGNEYYGWSQISIPGSPSPQNAAIPSDIARFSAISPSGPWTRLSSTTLYRTTVAEGVNVGKGQVADPSLVFDGTNTWMFVDADTTASSASSTIEAFLASNMTPAQVVNTYEGVQNYPIPNDKLSSQLITLASDNFQRANANPIGGNWTPLLAADKAQIVSDAVNPSAISTPGDSFWNALSFPNDQWAQVTVGAISGTTSFVGPAVRMNTSGTQSDYRVNWGGAATGAAGTIALQKYVSGTFTSLQSRALTLNVGDTITLSAIGQDLAVYWNNFLVLATTDSSLTSGAAGFSIYSGVATADAVITAWSGGNFQSIPPISSTGSGSMMMMGCGQ